MKFENKRNSKSNPLRYDLEEFNANQVKKKINLVINSHLYKFIKNKIPEKYLKIYFEKKLFIEFYELSSYLILYNWHKRENSRNFNKVFLNNNNIKYFFEKKEINNFKILYKLNVKKNLHNYFRYIFWKNIKQYLYLKNILLRFFKIKNNKDFSKKILVLYNDGHDLNKRSDLFWLKDEKIKKETLFYFQDKESMELFFKSEILLKKLSNSKIKSYKLWDFSTNNFNYYDQQINLYISNYSPKNSFEKWLKNEMIIMINKIDYWFNFFKFVGSRIHIGQTDDGVINIIKKIALSKLEIISIGKIKSYPNNIKSLFYKYYCDDVFFIWGKDSFKKINNSYNDNETYIISGFPYNINLIDKKKYQLSLIKKNFRIKNIKFSILLLDDNFSKNLNNKQVVDSNSMFNFYDSFFNLLIKNKDIGIIIKSKKNFDLNKIENFNLKLSRALKTGRLYIVNDSFGKFPSIYSKICNITVGISIFFPTALLECAIDNNKCLFYDYPNLNNLEKKSFSKYSKNIFFNNLNELIQVIIRFKNNRNLYNNLGDWSKIIKKFNHFIDYKGGERIGQYIKFILKYDKFNQNRKILIKNANREYSHKYGKNLIFKSIK
tara:strand:- start:28417 stop:30228 length:1812 start_codon:yes stop_codon:yes gene_type:complete